MSTPCVQYLPSGDTALTVQFGTAIDKTLNRRIMALSQLISAAQIPGLLEILPTYRSMLIHYNPLIISQADLISRIDPLMDSSVELDEEASAHWQIPICFDEEFAPDLNHVAAAAAMAADDVINTVLHVTYHIYMLGFAPGQPYMGDLPPSLNIPRRENPVPRIEKGSLVTATGLTIIYPFANPTGWHVIGRTPVEIFSLQRENPALFSPGDRVSLTAIDRQRFDDIKARVMKGEDTIDRLRIS